MRYKLKRPLPFAPDYEVGGWIETETGDIDLPSIQLSSAEIFLLTHLGFLEQCEPMEETDGLGWMPEEGKECWTIFWSGNIGQFLWEDSKINHKCRSAFGVFPTKELAEAHAKQLIEFSRKLRREQK